MKSINLKVVEIDLNGTKTFLDYKQQFISFLEFVPEGASVNELASLVSVAQKLRRATDTIQLDQSEWETLKARIEATKFTMVTQDVIDMVRAVTEAPEV